MQWLINKVLGDDVPCYIFSIKLRLWIMQWQEMCTMWLVYAYVWFATDEERMQFKKNIIWEAECVMSEMGSSTCKWFYTANVYSVFLGI